MPDLSVTINDHEMFGKIIGEWAKYKNLQPTTIAEFRQAANKYKKIVGNYVSVGADYDDNDPVNVLNLLPGILNVVVPARGHMAEPLPQGAWPLPAFYKDLAFGGTVPSVAQGKKQAFRHCRVADYCLGKCM